MGGLKQNFNERVEPNKGPDRALAVAGFPGVAPGWLL